MRLINTETFSLEDFIGRSPPYAILSHTWGEEEVSFQDFENPERARQKAGWRKAENACRLAARNGFSWLWIDTFCIDKRSSAELSEAFNSMFQWFKDSSLCLVYMADVVPGNSSTFDRSRWFTRGWTLIELIAPTNLNFYSRDWEFIEITGVDPFVLAGGDVKQVKVARRLYWASRRTTTRVEDEAYGIMGLFDVNMPLIYGEGRRAFVRLQDEIYKTTNDISIFAWRENVDWQELARDVEGELKLRTFSKIQNYFAKSPADFARCGAIFPPLGVKQDRENDDDLEDESLWDSMSTTSTLVQSSADTPANLALNHAIAFLNEDPELLPLFQVAMERPGVGVDRFRRILVSILRYLAVELAQEAKDKDQESSASFLRRYRLVIGSAVTANVAERTLKPVEIKQGPLKDQTGVVEANEDDTLEQDREDSEDGEDDKVAEDAVAEVDIQFHSIATFIRSSKAFEQMVKRLTDLAYPSFYSRATECVEKLLRTRRHESDDIEYWEAMRSRMCMIVSELRYSKPDRLLIDSQGKLSQLEFFQLKLESLTGEEWNWWPLMRPRPKLGPGESRLGWTCFEKYRRDSYAHRGYGLPDLRLRQYFYSPTSWEPPVSPEEFKDLFQYVDQREKTRCPVLPLHNADEEDLAPDTVSRIPQRFWNFNKRGNERENFWGIYIREKRSALITSVYILLSLTPFIGFCFLYSFGIIKGDIQDATTPLALSLTALSLFLGSIIKL
ncbi:heterokaryon incompatibility protein-domain-containing protein [Nemania abortiva]|nr:heterokaryon incompatibility protein-domain-containing protein [Nemania abortiva]